MPILRIKNKVVTTGYKVMVPTGKNYRCVHQNTSRVFKRGLWYEDTGTVWIGSPVYRSGFHSFLSKADAEWWQEMKCLDGVVVKVDVSGSTFVGLQDLRWVVVSRWIRICA